MKNILLPTDFSENSKNAIDYALKLFKNELCTFYFLHVQKVSNYITDDLMTAHSDESIYRSVVVNSKKELIDYVNRLRVEHKTNSHIYKELVDYDSLTDAINQVILSKKIDLIVMGTNGATGAREIIFGSNTLKVLRNVNCPTITIPENIKYQNPEKILFLCNSQIKLTPKLLEPLMDLCMKFNSELFFLQTESEAQMSILQKNNLEGIKKLYNKFKITSHSILDIPISDAINAIVQLKNIQFGFILLKKETFIERLFLGSKTDDINYNSHIPLLFLHENKA